MSILLNINKFRLNAYNYLEKHKIIPIADAILYTIWNRLWFKSLDYSLSLIFLTTYEIEHKKKKLKDNLIPFFIAISLAICLTPIGLFCMITWVILIRIIFRKKPYQLSIRDVDCKNDKLFIFDNKRNYEVLSTNLCLLPEFLSRLNNLHKTEQRLNEIGKVLTECSTNNTNKSSKKYDLNNNLIEEDSGFINIIDDFSIHSENIDFLCIQEIWTLKNAIKLKNILHKRFPYIVYDVGINTLSSNFLIGLDSGLMFCSKFPILNVEFKSFTQKMKTCRFSSKGLLTAKVYLGKSKNDKDVVGFISNTHLQSYQESTKIHSHQMDDILNWLNMFRKNHLDLNNEELAFDLICGDFNMDNSSPVDLQHSNHQLLQDYIDPISLGPGMDHPSSIGTEMRQFSLYDEKISTPEKLKDVLLNDRLRRWYVFDANIEKASFEMLKERPELSDDGVPILLPNVSGKRRVDRIFYNKENKLILHKYKFISSMTRLTDHIPISMQFQCKIDNDYIDDEFEKEKASKLNLHKCMKL